MTTPVLRVSSEHSSMNSSTMGTTQPVKTGNEISSITFLDSQSEGLAFHPCLLLPNRVRSKEG